MTENRPTDPAVDRERELIAAARRESAELAKACGPPPPPLQSVAGYRLIREIGRGGMGVVYEAEQEQPQRMVALKMIGGGALVDKHRVRLFEREIEILARLRHTAIATIHEAGQTQDGRHFFAMELVRGLPLTEYVRLKQLPLRDRLRLFCRICEAVHYAHQRGVSHCDLKPSNIVIDAEGKPKILDFGLARIRDSDGALKTAFMEVGKIMGTLPYMSPEQARVRPDELSEIDVRTDVYSLGVVLYELLTGQLPYDVTKATPQEALRIICEEEPRDPSSINRALRGDLETIVLAALEKDPSRRYDGAAALAEDIDRHLEKLPIRRRRPSTTYLFGKWVLRHRDAAVFLVIMFLVVAAFAIAMHVQAVDFARAEAAIKAAKEPSEEFVQRAVEARVRRASEARFRQVIDALEESADGFAGHYDPAATEALLRACLDVWGDTLGPAPALSAYVQTLRGECLTRLGRFAEAESLLENYTIFKDNPAVSDARKQQTLQHLIDLYDAWDKPEQAAEWRAKLEEAVSQASSPDEDRSDRVTEPQPAQR